MLWFVYNFLFAICYLLALPRFIFRMWKRGGYRKDFLQRLGAYSPAVAGRFREDKRVWVQAVSVGEIYVALKFMDEMRSLRPEISFVLSTTTSTGHRIAESRLDKADVLIYFPSDFPFVVRRVLDRIKPLALVLTEGEIWPNLIRYAKRDGVPVVVINGRISESSYRGYRLLRLFFGKVLADINAFFVQAAADREKLVDLGVAENRITVMGTAKYDVAQFDPDGEAKAREILRLVGMTTNEAFEKNAGSGLSRHSLLTKADDPAYKNAIIGRNLVGRVTSRGVPDGFSTASNDLIITGGSTWPGEEEVLLDIYRKLKDKFRNLKLVLVPRHAERSGEVEGVICRSGLSYIKRSDLGRSPAAGPVSPDVLLVNTTGELKNFYACASVIFVGKSLTSHGGQNIIEPALYAKPIIVGPNMENFAAVVRDFISANALIQVNDANGLEQALRALLSDPVLRESYGSKAGGLVKEKRGATRKSAELVLKII